MGMREVAQIIEEVRKGKPRRYMETFLKIETVEGLVPWIFNENQEYFYEQIFGSLGGMGRGLQVFALKSRKATFTTFVTGVAFTYVANVPGFHVLIIGAMEDHAEVALKMTDTFYNNLPSARDGTGRFIMRPTKSHWDQSYREVIFGPMVNGEVDPKLTSSISISTSRSTGFGRARTPKMVIFDEKAHFSQEHEPMLMPAVLNSLNNNAWRFDGSTPKGMKNGFANDFKAIKEKKVNAIYLTRWWFHSRRNAISREDMHVRPADALEMETNGGLLYTDEEKGVIKSFPQDQLLPESRILWRRWKIAEATQNSMGDEVRGRALFLQEYPENDVDCWMDIANPVFDVMMLRRMIDTAVAPLPEEKLREIGISSVPYPGLSFRAWQLPYSGGRYYGGMDLAKGVFSGDASVLEVFDARTGTFVAELYGRARLLQAAIEGAKVMEKYNMGLFAPEATGLGAGAVEAVKGWGYRNLYFRSPNKKVSISETRHREYGWETNKSTRSQMFLDFQEAIATGKIHLPNLDLIGAVQEWNPDPDSDEHTGDRVMAAMIAYSISLEGYRFPTQTSVVPTGGGERQVHVEAPAPFSRWLG